VCRPANKEARLLSLVQAHETTELELFDELDQCGVAVHGCTVSVIDFE